MAEEQIVSLEKGNEKVPPIVYGATGFTGLVTLGGKVFDQCADELLYPKAYHTYKKMALHQAISPALRYVEEKVAEAEWSVKIPKGSTRPNAKAEAIFLTQVMNDMEHTWKTAIKNAATMNRYGFSILEIVPRFRNTKYGSKYNDGLVGLEGLQVRGQGSVDRFDWYDKGRDIAGFYQKAIYPVDTSLTGYTGIAPLATQQLDVKWIPRKKFILCRLNPENDNPYGNSPLKGVWSAYKLLEAFQESEIIGTAQDNNAFKILYLPPEYLVEDADEDRKKSFQMYQKMMERAHQAKQSGFILPMLVDQDGNKMFDFEIKNISGTKSYDVEKIIERLTREIQVGLFSDVLSMGGSGGSYSLADKKMLQIEVAVKSVLNEIKDQFNHQLVKMLFQQNGWSLEGELPYFDYELPNSETLVDKGSFIQRVAAVGMLPVVPETVNFVLKTLGIDYQVPDDMSTEELRKIMSNYKSEAGGGMETGLPSSNGDGTGASGDSSISNLANTA